MQSDFQRTFTMMRPLDGEEAGSSGFCRIERSQSRGKLVFNIQGISAGGDLHAVLVKRDGNDWKVQDCGLLRVDQRGNATVTREIDGLTTQATAMHHSVGVMRVTPEGASLRLIGFIGKGKPIDRQGIEQAAARGFGVASSAVEDAVPVEPTVVPSAGVVPRMAPIAPVEPVTSAPSPAPEADIQREPTSETTPALPIQDGQGNSGLPENIWAAPPQDIGDFPAAGLPQELEGIVWPESILSLRELFERFDVVSPVTGSEAEVFIRIPLENSVAGVDHYLLGVRLSNGTITAIGYAIPGMENMPPVGLDGYTFSETPLGGYWIRWEAVE